MTEPVVDLDFPLTGKTALVTGGGSGIGAAIASAFAAKGARIAVVDLNADAAQRHAATLGADSRGFRCDVSDPASVTATVEEVVAAFGRVDVLVNSAGVALLAPAEELALDAWDTTIDVNLKGTFLMCQAVIPVMKRQRSGRILNASSFAAIIPSVGGAAYAASKSGVEGLTRVLAGELGAHEITVNCYAPGMIPTAMNRFADRTDAEKSRLLDTLTLRRWGSPKDVANLICFLASDLASYITGTMIDVSGGKFATQMPWVSHREP